MMEPMIIKPKINFHIIDVLKAMGTNLSWQVEVVPCAVGLWRGIDESCSEHQKVHERRNVGSEREVYLGDGALPAAIKWCRRVYCYLRTERQRALEASADSGASSPLFHHYLQSSNENTCEFLEVNAIIELQLITEQWDRFSRNWMGHSDKNNGTASPGQA